MPFFPSIPLVCVNYKNKHLKLLETASFQKNKTRTKESMFRYIRENIKKTKWAN